MLGTQAAWASLLFTFLLVLGACTVAPSGRDRTWVAQELSDRLGAGIKGEIDDDDQSYPKSVHLADGLDIDEAVACALWRHADLEATLLELDVSRAELDLAGLLRNPVLSLLLPLGPKQFEATFTVAVDALWQRPKRIALAQDNIEALAQDLVQAGLGRARLVRSAFVGVLDAQERLSIQEEIVSVGRQNVGFFQAVVDSGDLPKLSLVKAQRNFLLDEFQLVQMNATLGERRAVLLEAIGGDLEWGELKLVGQSMDEIVSCASLDELARRALAARPDLRAIEIRQDAALSRAQLQRSLIPALALTADVNGEGIEGFEAGPGLRAELPIFDSGETSAQVDEAKSRVLIARHRALSLRIRADVSRLHGLLSKQLAQLEGKRARIETTFLEATRILEARHEAGDVGRMELLSWRLSNLRNKFRFADAELRAREIRIQLEAAVGARIQPSHDVGPR